MCLGCSCGDMMYDECCSYCNEGVNGMKVYAVYEIFPNFDSMRRLFSTRAKAEHERDKLSDLLMDTKRFYVRELQVEE